MIGRTVRNPEIKQAVFTIKELTKTQEMQYERVQREKARRDMISRDAEIKADAIAEERARAEEEKAQAIAKLKKIRSDLTEEEINFIFNITAAPENTNNSNDDGEGEDNSESDGEDFEP